jgi:hypothetical protein
MRWLIFTYMFYLTALSAAGLCSVKWKDDRWMTIWKQGVGRGLIEVLSRNLPMGTEENHGNPQSGYMMFRPRFKLRKSRIGVDILRLIPRISVIFHWSRKSCMFPTPRGWCPIPSLISPFELCQFHNTHNETCYIYPLKPQNQCIWSKRGCVFRVSSKYKTEIM